MIELRAGRRAGPPEPSRCARPHRSRPLTGVLSRSRFPLLRCRGWHGFRPSRHFRPPSLLRHPGSHHSALAIHQNAPFGGWAPAPSPNRPGLGLVSRKVGAFSGGPSMPEACFPEGPDIILGDQPRRDRLFGRSWGCWQGRWCYPHVFCRGYCQKRRFLRVPSFVFPRVESLGPPADACQGRWCWWGVAGWGGTRRHATPG